MAPHSPQKLSNAARVGVVMHPEPIQRQVLIAEHAEAAMFFAQGSVAVFIF